MVGSVNLWLPERHEEIEAADWSDGAVREALNTLITEIRSARRDDGHWPSIDDGEEDIGFRRSLYAGTAGILWGLQALAARGFGSDEALAPMPDKTPEDEAAYRVLFDEFKVPVSKSLLLGSVGEDFLDWQRTRDPALLDRIDRDIAENENHLWMELLWGAPTTMLAAHHLYRATGQERFADHIRSGARYMEERLEEDPDLGCELWSIPLYGETTKILGAGHGFVSCVTPILLALDVFPVTEQERWCRRIRQTVIKTAMRRDGLTNWPATIGTPRMGRSDPMVQWCHGAPGFVVGLASLIGQGTDELDTLLFEAGDLIWAAGPIAKYPGICHGTPGNGYAFLKLYAASGDEKWFARARRFAMQALEQRTAQKAAGVDKWNLFEGDMGLAVYLADCLEAKAGFPLIDVF